MSVVGLTVAAAVGVPALSAGLSSAGAHGRGGGQHGADDRWGGDRWHRDGRYGDGKHGRPGTPTPTATPTTIPTTAPTAAPTTAPSTASTTIPTAAPTTVPSTTAPVAELASLLPRFVGLTPAQGLALAKELGVTLRVIEPGKAYTMDYRTDRITADAPAGVITTAKIG